MKTIWLKTVPLVMAASLFTAATALAAQPASREGHPRSWEQRLQQRLGLTEEQVQAIRQIHERDAEARKQHGQALRLAQIELRRAVLTNADEATLQVKQAEVARLLAESLQMRVNTLRAIAPLLTPEQREQYAKLMEEGRGFRRPRPQS
jgi:Spy/CpxP family protein refolding chaperone